MLRSYRIRVGTYSFALLMATQNEQSSNSSDLLSMWSIFCRALRTGAVKSYMAPEGGQPLIVPRWYWNNCSFGSIYRGTAVSDDGSGCPILQSREEFQLWLSGLGPQIVETEPRQSTMGAQKRCEKWLSECFSQDPDNQRTKELFKDEALLKFDGLSGRGFTRAWAEVAPLAGRSKAGRKSSRRIDTPKKS